MMKKAVSIILLALLGLALTAAVVGLRRYYAIKELQDMYSLNSNGRIVAMLVSGQQIETNLTDTAVLNVINQSFHNSQKSRPQAGVTFLVTFKFTSGYSVDTWIHIHDDLGGFTVAIPTFWDLEDPNYCAVSLPKPVPENVKGFLKYLRTSP